MPLGTAVRVEARRAGGAALAWLPTLQAKGRAVLAAQHLRWRHPAMEPATLHLLLLDTSGSMRQGTRLARAKGYAAMLVQQAARAGAQVGVLCFGGQGVEVLLPPGPARRAGAVRVQQRGGGGGTPLAQALAAAESVLHQHRRVRGASGGVRTVLWLLTDGRTVEQPPIPRGVQQVVLVDFDDPMRPVGRCAEWAQRWGAQYRRAPAAA